MIPNIQYRDNKEISGNKNTHKKILMLLESFLYRTGTEPTVSDCLTNELTTFRIVSKLISVTSLT